MSKISVIFYCEDAINAQLHAAHTPAFSKHSIWWLQVLFDIDKDFRGCRIQLGLQQGIQT